MQLTPNSVTIASETSRHATRTRMPSIARRRMIGFSRLAITDAKMQSVPFRSSFR